MTTSDSIDRVFSHALATVRRLPRTGSSRPPPSARLRLYGLYKQSMEGDVDAILPRPTLPPPSPSQSQQQQDYATDTRDQTTATTTMTQQDASNNAGGSALTRYGSRQLRTREAQAEIEKWDAWHACKGMSRTAAKKAYIRTLIETMKEYASGTQESRELVGELEFVWRQVSRRASGSREGGNDDDGDDDDDDEDDDDGYGDTEEDSPRRSGLVQVGRGESFGGNRPQSPSRRRKGRRSNTGSSDARGGGGGDKSSRMTLLSPVGQSEADGSVVANEEVIDASESASASAASSSPKRTRKMVSKRNNDNTNNPNGGDHGHDGVGVNAGSGAGTAAGDDPWRHSVEAHLRHLSTEIAALREQLSSHYLLAPTGYSPYVYQHLSFRWRLWYKMLVWVRWAVWMAVRQALIQLSLLGLAIVYGRWKGDRRLETWLRQRITVTLSWARRSWDWRWMNRLPFG